MADENRYYCVVSNTLCDQQDYYNSIVSNYDCTVTEQKAMYDVHDWQDLMICDSAILIII